MGSSPCQKTTLCFCWRIFKNSMNEVDEMKANNCTGLHSTSTSLGFFFLGRGGGGEGGSWLPLLLVL